MSITQDIVDALIDHIDKAIAKGSVTNQQVAGVLYFLNERDVYKRQVEDEVYGKYDEEVNDYIESRERVNTVDNLHVQTGFKTEKELMFILDMLSSDEIYLIGYENRGIRVNASADSLAIAKNMNTPQSLPITLRFCDSEKHFTQELNSDDFNNPRIHTDAVSYTHLK